MYCSTCARTYRTAYSILCLRYSEYVVVRARARPRSLWTKLAKGGLYARAHAHPSTLGARRRVKFPRCPI